MCEMVEATSSVFGVIKSRMRWVAHV